MSKMEMYLFFWNANECVLQKFKQFYSRTLLDASGWMKKDYREMPGFENSLWVELQNNGNKVAQKLKEMRDIHRNKTELDKSIK